MATLAVEMKHVRDKVDDIDRKLEGMNIGSRLAVLEDRQTMVFRLIYGVIALFGTSLAGIIVHLFTH